MGIYRLLKCICTVFSTLAARICEGEKPFQFYPVCFLRLPSRTVISNFPATSLYCRTWPVQRTFCS